MDKELEELFKPTPFNHNCENFYSACGVKEDRSNGVLYFYEKLMKKKMGKRSEIIEQIENTLDLTKREQIILAFKLGQSRGE